MYARLRAVVMVACACLLQGCSLAPLKQQLAPDNAALDRFPRVHRPTSYERVTPDSLAPGLTGATPSGASIDLDLHRRFLLARQKAMVENNPTTSKDYFDAGRHLVGVLCGRWFGDMEAEERRLDSVDKSFNVWKAFGTTLLGLSKATSSAISLYGSLTTVEGGLSTAYKDVYLLNGSISKVKQRIFGLLDQYTEKARPDINDYGAAYASLERMGALCSPAAARVVIDAGLDTSEVQVDGSGAIRAMGNSVSAAAAGATEADRQRVASKQLAARLDQAIAERTREQVALDQRLAAREAQHTQALAALATADAAQKALLQRAADPNATPAVQPAELAAAAERVAAAQQALIEERAALETALVRRNQVRRELSQLGPEKQAADSASTAAEKSYEQAIERLRQISR
jgi:hypothetical protein